MRKVKKTLAFHFGEVRSASAIAAHCRIARCSVMQTLEPFAPSVSVDFLKARDSGGKPRFLSGWICTLVAFRPTF